MVTGLVVLVAFLSSAAVAYAYLHTYNGVNHGLSTTPGGDYPVGVTYGPESHWSSAEIRHYFPDGSYNRQCYEATYGIASCIGTWGSEPCQKRYVGGTEGLMPRHWVRRGPSCAGQIHG